MDLEQIYPKGNRLILFHEFRTLWIEIFTATFRHLRVSQADETSMYSVKDSSGTKQAMAT